MNTRQLTGFLQDLLEPLHHDCSSFRVAGPTLAGRAFRGNHPRELTVVAHSSASSQAAERLRLALIDGAGRLQADAWSVATPVAAVDLPPALIDHPATMLRWVTRTPTRELYWTAAWVRTASLISSRSLAGKLAATNSASCPPDVSGNAT